MGFLNTEPADHSSVESSERSKNATESQSQVSPYISIQDPIESDTQPGESDLILMLAIDGFLTIHHHSVQMKISGLTPRNNRKV
jgi:hypothetical protein